MTSPLFTVLAAEVDRDGQTLRRWEIPDSWLASALADSEGKTTQTPGQFSVDILKNGPDFIVRGKITAQVELPCARTLDPAIYDLSAELFLVLRRKSGSHDRGKAPKAGAKTAPNPAEKPAKPARVKSHQPKADQDDGHLLSEDDAASDTFSGESIVLDDFVREQILLELPMFPLRSDLRSQPEPAIQPLPHSAGESDAIDPRLAPLQALKAKLKV